MQYQVKFFKLFYKSCTRVRFNDISIQKALKLWTLNDKQKNAWYLASHTDDNRAARPN